MTLPHEYRRRYIRFTGRLLIGAVIALGPIAMLAGLSYPPEAQYGPNAALGTWIPGALIGFSFVGIVAQYRRFGALLPVFGSLSPYLLATTFGAVSLLWSPAPHEGSNVLLKLLVLIPIFMAAWPMRVDARERAWLRRGALISLATIWILFLTGWAGAWLPPSDLGRLMGIVTLGLPPLFVLATYARYSTVRTALIGAAVLLLALASDARMVALVLAILIVTAPSLDVKRWVRLALVSVGLLVVFAFAMVGGLETQIFFFDEGESVSGFTLSGNGLLGGRGDVWTELWARCDDSLVVGNGLGASNTWGLEVNTSFPEPHNEYLRTVCDLGLPATLAFWAFFVVAGVHAARRVVGKLQPSASGLAAMQLLLALGLFATTDIPLTATAQFYAPLAMVLAWSEQADDQL